MQLRKHIARRGQPYLVALVRLYLGVSDSRPGDIEYTMTTCNYLLQVIACSRCVAVLVVGRDADTPAEAEVVFCPDSVTWSLWVTPG